VNGVPASRRYRGMCEDMITFFDTRIESGMLASDDDLLHKQALVRAGAPLRLGFSGRLEPLKGADHLIAVARHLAETGFKFSLDIFGAGSLAERMQEDVRSAHLERVVTLHGAVDFASELVPRFRASIDVFVCCHRQSDPSCTYMEAMGCGVALAGYSNEALGGILELSDVGVGSSMDDPERLARSIIALSSDREGLAGKMGRARELSRTHCFESTFARRVEQCVRVASGNRRPPASRPGRR
jgi:glycosyltransferase involved in cell wall biosynthesis